MKKKITVREFLEQQVYVDPRFQRNACWKANPEREVSHLIKSGVRNQSDYQRRCKKV